MNRAGPLLLLVVVTLFIFKGAAIAQIGIGTESLRQYYVPHVEDLQSHGRVPPDFDIEKLVRRLSQKHGAGITPERVSEFFTDELLKSFFSFTKKTAMHDKKAVYALPFSEESPRMLSHGPGDGELHQGVSRESFDFLMPVGTPVLAARSGVAARVIRGYTEGGREEKFISEGNVVFILHEDGSFAQYAHLSPEGLVEAGSQVEVGQRIGLSGVTGFTAEPHLHFGVRLLRAPFVEKSVPIEFLIRSKKVSKMQRGRKYP
jgi:murein DD-endopeptidase MepM/ murein hydrolase activator NlpD